MFKNGPKGVHRRTKAKKSFELNKFVSPDLVPYDFFFVPEDKGIIERKAF